MSAISFVPMSSEHRDIRQSAVERNVAEHAIELTEQEFADYLTFVPQRGDVGVLAYKNDELAGTAWATFVAGNEIPDLVTSVVEEYQGQGVAAAMLDYLLEHARRLSWSGISVRIDDAHPARRVYARLGFESLADGSMVLHLRAPVRSVAVYCGSAKGARGEYVDDAEALGTALAEAGIELVYGGGSVGLMGALGSAVIDAGGTAVGVMPRELVDREMAHHGLTRLEVVDTMAERKDRMEEMADAFVALPGGVGTLEELFQVFTGQQLGHHACPIALINTEGFWNPMIASLQRMAEEGFIAEKFLDALIIADDVPHLFEQLENWRAPGPKWEE